MNRRRFLQCLGFGAAAAAVPAVVSAAPEKSGMALMAEAAPTIGDGLLFGELGWWEGFRFYTKTVSLEEARAMYPPSDLRYTDEEITAMDAQARPPLVINKIKPQWSMDPLAKKKYTKILLDHIERGYEIQERFLKA